MRWSERSWWLLWFLLMWMGMREADERSLDAERRMEALTYDTRQAMAVFDTDLTRAEERLEALEAPSWLRRAWQRVQHPLRRP